MTTHNKTCGEFGSHNLYVDNPVTVNISKLTKQNIEPSYLLNAVEGAPAYLGRLIGSASSCFSGKGITACNSIIRFTASTIPGKASTSQFAESAIVRYLCASSISYFARLTCWASWSRQASMIFCRMDFGFLLSSKNSKEGNAGTCFTEGALDSSCKLISSYPQSNSPFGLGVLGWA